MWDKNALELFAGLNFEELFDASTSQYVIKQYFMQNKQFSNLQPKMSNICNFGLQEKLLPYLKLAPSNLSNCKVLCKKKCLSSDHKDLFRVFLD